MAGKRSCTIASPSITLENLLVTEKFCNRSTIGNSNRSCVLLIDLWFVTLSLVSQLIVF